MMNQTTLPTGNCEWTVTETSEIAVCNLVQRILTASATRVIMPVANSLGEAEFVELD